MRMQCCCQRVDFAFQLGDTTVGLLLTFPRRRRCDAGLVSEPLHEHLQMIIPWSPSLCASPARSIGVFLVAAHLQTSARVTGAWALEVSAVLRRRRSWSRMGAILVALVFVLVFVVIAFGKLRRCLLQRWIQACARWKLRQLRGRLLRS